MARGERASSMTRLFTYLIVNAEPRFGSYRLIKKCCVKIPLFEDIVIVIMGDLAITSAKLNEQELMSAELCRLCCILNLLSLD